MRKWLICTILFLSLISGCGFSVAPTQTTTVSQTVGVNQEIVDRIKRVSLNIPKEDKEILYKACIGFTHLVDNVVPDTTVDAFEQLRKVERMYGFNELKYPDFDTEVYKILTERRVNLVPTDGTVPPFMYATFNYKVPQKISECKDNLKLIFTSIAEGVK